MRPKSYPHNIINKILIYIITAIFLSILCFGFYKDNIYLILIGSVSFAFLYYIFCTIIYYITTKVEFTERGIKTVNRDFISGANILLNKKQEIDFCDIDYVYFAEKEIYTVKAIKEKLGKYKISKYETDVRKENLINKYNVPEDLIEKITSSKGVRFNENNVCGMLLLLDELETKYRFPEELIKNIKIDLSKTQNYSISYLENQLAEYNIKREDMAKLRKQLKVMEVEIIDAICITYFSLVGYKELSNKKEVDWTLVLSSKDGNKKAYITHFLDYSLEERKKLLQTIKEKSKARFLLDLDTLIEHGIEK